MKHVFFVLICFLLAACQPAVKPASDTDNVQRQLERELYLQKQNQWSFRGRAAISDGQQAGTVKMLWRQTGRQFDIEISLPISYQKYHLRNVGDTVRLESYGLETVEGASAEAILQQVTGWRIPFGDMQLWLRGMRSSEATKIDFGSNGLPAQFREKGWLVDYRSWNSEPTPMPMKVFASADADGKKASVRLHIDAWDVP